MLLRNVEFDDDGGEGNFHEKEKLQRDERQIAFTTVDSVTREMATSFRLLLCCCINMIHIHTTHTHILLSYYILTNIMNKSVQDLIVI